MKADFQRVYVAVGFALAFTVHSALQAVVTGGVPAATAILVIAFGAAVVSGAFAGPGLVRRLRALPRQDLALAAAAGVLGGLVAPLAVASNRYTDAPPGSELLFFTGACWAAVACVVAIAALLRHGRRTDAIGVAAGALAGLVGCAGILANWERPSSFSPLVRFPVEEFWMVAAGVAFVAFGVAIARRWKTSDARALVAAAGLAALAAALVWWLVAGGQSDGIAAAGQQWESLLLWALSWGLVFTLWPRALHEYGVGRSGSLMLWPPVLLSLLTFVEQRIGAAGPQPLLLPAVFGGTLLVIAATARLWTSARPESLESRQKAMVLAGIGGVVVLVAVAGLFLPALSAYATGMGEGGAALAVGWVMPAVETVSGWAAVALAALALAAVWDVTVWPALLTLAATWSYALLLTTPVHVLTRWLPIPIVQDLGSEYATIEFNATINVVQRVAVAGTAFVLVVVLLRHLWALRATRVPVGTSPARGPESASDEPASGGPNGSGSSET